MSSKSVLLLRVGIALAFFYAAISSFLVPDNWIGYFPQFMRDLVPNNILLNTFSVYEVALGIWIVSGWKTFYSSLLASATLLGIIGFNYLILDVVFRDIPILFASLALALTDTKN